MANITRHGIDIYEVDELVALDELSSIMQLASMIDLWNYDPTTRFDSKGNVIYDADAWIETTCGADILFDISPMLYSTLEACAKRVMREAEQLFDCSLIFREPSLVRLDERSKVGQAHADKENIDGTPKLGMEDYDISAVMYHNEDFRGGDLVFPQHNVRISPTAGKVAIFPGDATHLHYVDTIKKGARWSSPLFFSIVG
jgi:hypothetical protein